MEVVLLGTGSADGWPNPWCPCASCGLAGATGLLRTPTAALVDDVLLLDCGPEAPRQALRAGRDLHRVRVVALTHDHPDHWAPAALLFRAWANGGGSELVVAGPAATVAAARDWIGPDDPVRLVQLAAGEAVELAGYTIRALAAAHEVETLLYDVTGPDGARLLHGTDTGPLPAATLAALAGSALDLALLEETFGDHAGHGTDHLDLASFPREVSRLREVGALGPASQVVAVHLSHHNPPDPELSRRLAAWDARPGRDGEVITVGGAGRRRAPRPHRTLVLGGARSGKSVEAERLLAAEPAVVYVATGGTRDDDAEWVRRVAAHRARRPAGWSTVETTDLAVLLASPGPPLLIDCLGLWLTAVLDAAGAWDGGARAPGDAGEMTGQVGGAVDAAVDAAVAELVAAWSASPRRVVAVSNEVGSGIVPATASGRCFRDALGRLNTAVAAASESVRWVLAGRVLELAGGPPPEPAP